MYFYVHPLSIYGLPKHSCTGVVLINEFLVVLVSLLSVQESEIRIALSSNYQYTVNKCT